MDTNSSGLPNPESDLDFLVEQLADDDDDAFGYLEIAESLGQTLSRASPPFVYGICGPWGSGKSSLLRYLVRHLPGNAQRNIGIHFNAWKATLHSDLRLAFIMSVLGQLRESIKEPAQGGRNYGWKRNLDDTLEKLESLYDAALEALQAKEGITGFLAATAHRYSQKAEGQAAAALTSELEHHQALVWLGNRIREEGISCFVLIDELDRCSPPDVVRVLEAIRVFFFGSDKLEEEVAQRYGEPREHARSPFRFIMTIEEQYIIDAFASHYNIETQRAAMYLDKFIQFRFHFPRKDWGIFVSRFLEKHGNMEWFPSGEGNLSQILSTFKVVDPRTAGRALGYLLFWQARLYPTLKEVGVLILLRQSLAEQHSGCVASALSAVNGALLAWAMIKLSFPEHADRVVGARVVENLPCISDDSDVRTQLFESTDDEEICNRWGNRTLDLLDALRQVQGVISSGIECSGVPVKEQHIGGAAQTVLREVFKN